MTGSKKGAISVHGCAKFDECPNTSPHTDFLIGRTEYSIMMYDSRNVNGNAAAAGRRSNAVGKSWNITFYDYSSSLGGSEVGPDYGRTLFLYISFITGFLNKILENTISKKLNKISNYFWSLGKICSITSVLRNLT